MPATACTPRARTNPYFGIPPIDYPSDGSGFGGSALVIWDSGTPTPPTENVPPRPEEGYGEDPHSDPRNEPAAREQKSDFLKVDGGVTDVCGGPCYAAGYTGTAR